MFWLAQSHIVWLSIENRIVNLDEPEVHFEITFLDEFSIDKITDRFNSDEHQMQYGRFSILF